ncbi:TMEM175 family protein [Lentzea sp. NPDC004782]|uniref:TMEM175 family protein n=1 Tax=Lentzea sp. NPDC004782 TaxID=3154458 RepID=UPI00339DAE6E
MTYVTDAVAPTRETDSALERLTFFSDAVIAIAMTLLALELPVPEGENDGELWQSFLHLLPRQYLTFVLGFVVIAMFWHSHHRFFQHVTALAPGLVRANTVFLFTVVTLPFATRVLGERGESTFGTVFYALAVTAVGLSLLALLWLVRKHGVVHSDADPEWPGRMARGILVPVSAFVISIPVAFVDNEIVRYSWVPLAWLIGLAVRGYLRLRRVNS